MAKAKRERRNSFRTMAGDQALDVLDRIEQVERQEQQSSTTADVPPAVTEPEDAPETDKPSSPGDAD